MTDEVRDMIGRALEDEPPLRIDYEAVRTGGRRRLVRRQLGIAGAAVLSVVAVVGAAITVGQLTALAPSDPAGPVLGTETPAPATSGCFLEASGYAKTGEARLAESGRLTDAVRTLRLPLPAGATVDPPRLALCVTDDGWGTRLTVRGPAGDRQVMIEVSARGDRVPAGCDGFTRRGCQLRELPDGTAIRIVETAAADATPSGPVVDTIAWRPDGTVVLVEETPAGSSSAPRVFGDDALVSIVAAPQLRVRWGVSVPTSVRAVAPNPATAAQLTAMLAATYRLPAGVRVLPGPPDDPAMTFVATRGGYRLHADLADSSGEGSLTIELNPDRPYLCPQAEGCEMVILSDGRAAGQATRTENGITTLTLQTVSGTGTQVLITSSNRPARAPAPGRTGTLPPLDAHELVRIAVDAGRVW